MIKFNNLFQTDFGMNMDYGQKIALASKLIDRSSRLVIFTGAGVSTESGLPDYRGPDGVWTRRDKGLPPPRSKPMAEVRPNRTHYSIVELHKRSKLDFLISQNVDNLHLRSGIPLHIIAELHGNHALMKCMECDHRLSFTEAGWSKKKWGTGYRTQEPMDGQPKCPECRGRLISSVVNFGDPMPEREIDLSMEHSRKCDLFMVIGSSLVVTPACNMPLYALENDAKLIMINRGETPFDDMAHLRFWEDAGDVMENIVKRID